LGKRFINEKFAISATNLVIKQMIRKDSGGQRFVWREKN
jgi:hypothetical protein